MYLTFNKFEWEQKLNNNKEKYKNLEETTICNKNVFSLKFNISFIKYELSWNIKNWVKICYNTYLYSILRNMACQG